MAIDIVDVVGLAHEKRKRQRIMDTKKMSAWMHCYPNPGDHDELHCHPGDQTFLLLEGECTMSFPDGGASVLRKNLAWVVSSHSRTEMNMTHLSQHAERRCKQRGIIPGVVKFVLDNAEREANCGGGARSCRS